MTAKSFFLNKTSHRLVIIGSHWVHILPSKIHQFSDDFETAGWWNDVPHLKSMQGQFRSYRLFREREIPPLRCSWPASVEPQIFGKTPRLGMRTANGREVWLPNDIRAAAVPTQALRPDLSSPPCRSGKWQRTFSSIGLYPFLKTLKWITYC